MQTAYKVQQSADFTVWTRDQCHDLHLKSLEILERTGILVHDEKARDIYKKGGALVKDEQVYIPAWMVKEALQKAPERIVLKGRDNYRVRLEKNVVNYGPGTDLPFFQDYITGKYRNTSYQDIENVARLVDYLPNFDFIASLGIARDVTTELADLYHFKAMLENTIKPILMTARDEKNLKGLIDMAAALLGGYEELKHNPLFLLYTEPISPLVNSPEAHQKLMMAAEYEIPVTYASGISSGGTGPVTLAGSLALGNAEGLSGLVLHQLVNPGAPFLYGIVPGPMDMATMISRYTGPEMPLNFAVIGEMSRYYKLPTFGTAGCTDSAVVDHNAAIDSTFSIFVAALGGTNLVHDNGYIGNGLVGSLEMLLLNNEAISMTKRFMQGIEINDETLALDLIHEMGPGGDFQQLDNNFKNIKKENYLPRFFNKNSYKKWKEKRTNLKMKDQMKEEIKYILENHKANSLKESVREELDLIIKEHEKRVRQ